MRKIIEYKIIATESCKELNVIINNLIDLGYQPFGYISINNELERFFQVMVKYEEEGKDERY